MTNIHIPPAALEAGARAIAEMDCGASIFGTCERYGGCMCREQARAAFVAMVEAWPGMATYSAGINGPYPYLILPLQQETRDDQ